MDAAAALAALLRAERAAGALTDARRAARAMRLPKPRTTGQYLAFMQDEIEFDTEWLSARERAGMGRESGGLRLRIAALEQAAAALELAGAEPDHDFWREPVGAA